MNNEFKQRGDRRLLWGTLGSAFLHLLLLLMRFGYAPTPLSIPSSEDIPIEISQVPEEYLRQEPPPEKAVVRKEPEVAETEDAGNRELDPNATVLSDRTQTAKEQTKAATIDDFREKQGTGIPSSAEGPSGIAATGESAAETEPEESPLEVEDGIGTAAKQKGVKRDWKTLSLKDLSVNGNGGALGSTDDRLTGIAEGDRTVLSTREFRYFSYYHRIKELLRQYWKPEVERKLTLIFAKGQTIRSEEMTTQLLILLNQRGEIQKISRLTSSGFHEVDEAAIQAFHKAAPFPNPPRGIVDPDGFVRIRWDFILKAQAAPTIQFQRNPTGGIPDRLR